MCHHPADHHTGMDARRELRLAGGRILQCLGCGSIGVEFGTCYLVFEEADFFAFAQWFENLSWEEKNADRGKLHIKVRDDSSLMLCLAREELQGVAALLQEGVRWVASTGLAKESSSVNAPQLSPVTTVH
ncbi:MAG: DUF6686 family protein [Acidobacteriota bacterium]